MNDVVVGSYLDDDGGPGRGAVYAVELAPSNSAPVADAGGPYSIGEGDSIVLDGTASSDPESDPLTYSWDLDNDATFGDATGVSPNVTWSTLQSFGIGDDGSYTVGLQVDDGNGGTDATTATLTVSNTAPAITVTGGGAVLTGSSYTVNLAASDPGADTVTSWTIDWGDGTVDTIAGDPSTAAHTYAVDGPFAITASVVDEDGTWTDADLIVPTSTAGSSHLGRYDGTTGAVIADIGAGSPLDGGAAAVVGPDGSVYVSSSATASVERFDPVTNAWTDTFVAASSGGLVGPKGLTFGRDGNLYVSDFGSNAVRRYDGTTGAFVDTFVTAGSGGLTKPNDLTFGPDGHLYVVSYDGLYEVRKYDGTTGAHLADFVAHVGTEYPEGLTFGPDGNLYLAFSSTDLVRRYNGSTGAAIGTFVAAGSGGLNSPSGLLFGPDGHLYVASELTDQILRYDGSTGSFLDVFVTAGSGGLDAPGYPAFVADHHVVASSSNTAPIADAGGPYTIGEGDSVALDGTASSDPDANPLTYSWDLDNDSIFGDVTGSTPSVSWSTLQLFGVNDDGSYTVGVQVADGLGGTDTATTTLTVDNTAPTISVTGSGSPIVAVPYTVNLAVTDPGADTVTSWTINWGDGTIDTIAGNPSSASHAYLMAVPFAITAAVTDEDGTSTDADLFVPGFVDPHHLGRYDGTTGAFETSLTGAPTAGVLASAEIGPDGNLYVTNFDVGEIHRFDPATNGYLGVFASGLDSPTGLAWGPDGNLYVSEFYAARVGRYDASTGAFIDAFVAAGSGGLVQPTGMVFSADGRLYVADWAGGAIRRYDAGTGAFVDTFATTGANATQDLEWGPGGDLYVAVGTQDRVTRYDGTTGAFVSHFVPAATGGLDTPTGIEWGPDGDLYVSSSLTDQIKRYDGSTGAYLGNFVAAAAGGLDRPFYGSFLPEHLVSVVPNTAPTADAGGPYAIAAGSDLTLDGTGSSDPESDPLTYSWDLDGNATYGDVTGATPTVSWATLQSFGITGAGTHAIGLQVDDGVAGTAVDTAVLTVSSNVVVVNSTDDDADESPGDGVCTTGQANGEGAAECTLRAAIAEANAAATVDTIEFAIPTTDPGHASGIWTIAPASALPAVSATVTIDGLTQPGASANTLAVGNDAVMAVVLDGSSAGSASGLELAGGASTVSGLVVHSFALHGIRATSDGNALTGLWIGLGADGTTAAGNGVDGIRVEGAGTTVGGTSPSARNVVVGNAGAGIRITGEAADSNIVVGNHVGVDAVGTAAVPNAIGIEVDSGADDTTIGGTTDAAANVVSGNSTAGIVLRSATTIGSTVTGNVIGLDPTATTAVGNAVGIVVDDGVAGATIGGTANGAGNTIGGNTAEGVLVYGSTGAAPDDVTLLGNSISGNGGLGIDLSVLTTGGDGVSANDAGDLDGGANQRRNFPVITSASAASGRIELDLQLDLPAGTYRIEVFRNESADPSGHGEGDALARVLSVTHPGGGTVSVATTLWGAAGDVLTATTTEDLGGGAHGATSEFSAAVTVAAGSTVLDRSTRRSDLTAAGGLDVSGPGSGMVASGVDLAGGTERLAGPSAEAATTSLTLSGWVNAASLTGEQHLVSRSSTASGAISELAVDTAGDAIARLLIDEMVVEARGGTVTTGGWHQLAATWDAATLRLYVDGVEVAAVAASGTLDQDVSATVTVGNTATADGGVDGSIDQVTVVRSARSAAWIATEFRNLSDPSAMTTVGAPQASAPGTWSADTAVTRSGSHALAAPTTAAGSDAWAVVAGLDEPGLVLDAWWYVTDPASSEVAAGTNTGSVPTDQRETAATGAGFDLGAITGATRTVDATSPATVGAGVWTRVEIRTDETGTSTVWLDGTQIIGPTAQTAGQSGGSAGLRVGELPAGTGWYVDDVRVRRYVSSEPTASLGAFDRR